MDKVQAVSTVSFLACSPAMWGLWGLNAAVL